MKESADPSVGVCILAGGESVRLPGKIGLPIDGTPMLLRLIAAFSDGREVVVSTHDPLPRELATSVRVPVVADVGGLERGPLLGMRTTLVRMRSPWVLVIAGDSPFAGLGLASALLAARESKDEAVVPVRTIAGMPILEPLHALYDRAAFIRAAHAADAAGERAVKTVLGRLRMRRVSLADERALLSVNTPEEYRSALRLPAESPAAERGTNER